MNKNKILTAIVFFLFIAAVGCSDGKEKSVANIDIDGVKYDIKSGGVGYEVVSNQVDCNSGHQFIVEMTVSNNTHQNLIFDSTTFLLITKSGQEISLSTNNDVAGIANKAFYNTQISPGATQLCILMFSIKEAGNNKLKIASPKSETYEIINL